MIRLASGAVSNRTRSLLGRDPLPRILTWTLTFRCNARCSMCDSWRKTDAAEADTTAALEIVRRIPTSVSIVRLTGGEPFVRHDIGEIVHALETRLAPEVVHLTSNGFLTDRIAGFLSDRRAYSSRKLHLLVSVDGMSELHNGIRGRENAFAMALATIRQVAERRREWNVDIAVNQTIVDQRGIDDYERLHALLAGLSVPHHVVVAYAESAMYSVEPGRDLSPVDAGSYRTATPIDTGSLRAFLALARRDTAELPFANRIAKRYYLDGIANRLLKGEGTPNPRCAALGGHMRIHPNGDIPVCQFNGRIAGNILRDGFEAVWGDPGTRAHREWVARCAGCWAECEVLPSAVLGGDIAGHAMPRWEAP